MAIEVRITNLSPVLKLGDDKLQLKADVTGAANKKEENVSWSIIQGSGEISAAGVLSAKHRRNEYSITVKAVSRHDSTASDQVDVLVEKIKHLSIAPKIKEVIADETVNFQAKYDLEVDAHWEIIQPDHGKGVIDFLTGLYQAPPNIKPEAGKDCQKVIIKLINLENDDEAETVLKLLPVKMETNNQEAIHVGQEGVQLAIKSINDILGIRNYSLEIISRPKIGEVASGGVYIAPKSLYKKEIVKVKAVSLRSGEPVVLEFEVLNFPIFCPRCHVKKLDENGECEDCGSVIRSPKVKNLRCPRCNSERWDGIACKNCNYPRGRKSII